MQVVKKAKMVASAEKSITSYIDQLQDDQAAQEGTKMNFMTTVVKELQESSRLNMEKLEAMVTNSTSQLTNTMNMKMLLETDLSWMNAAFQGKQLKSILKTLYS